MSRVLNGTLTRFKKYDASNGEYVLNLSRTGETGHTYLEMVPVVDEDNLNKIITLHADIYTPNNLTLLQILNNGRYYAAEVPINTVFQRVSVSTTLTDPEVKLFINTMKETCCMIDNIKISIQ